MGEAGGRCNVARNLNGVASKDLPVVALVMGRQLPKQRRETCQTLALSTYVNEHTQTDLVSWQEGGGGARLGPFLPVHLIFNLRPMD